VPDDEAVLDPPVQGASTNSQAVCDLCFREHSAVPQPVIARAESILVDQIGHAQVREAEIGLASTRGAAGTDSSLVEDVRNLYIDVIVEELVDEFDHYLRRFDLLCGGFGVLRCQGLRFSTFEADVDLCREPFWRDNMNLRKSAT
jgi:hypothetical protein